MSHSISIARRSLTAKSARRLRYATDRASIVQYLLRGQARLADGLLPPGNWAAAPNLPSYPYDPARAEQLLDAAGFPRRADLGGMRLHLTLKTSTEEYSRLLGSVLSEQWRKVGVDLELRTLEFGTLYADITRGNFELYTLRWIGVNNDPSVFQYVFESDHTPPAGFNRGHYRNPQLDALMAQAASEPNLDRSAKRSTFKFSRSSPKMCLTSVCGSTTTSACIARASPASSFRPRAITIFSARFARIKFCRLPSGKAGAVAAPRKNERLYFASASRISLSGKSPSRIMCQLSAFKPTIVEARPTPVSPASSTSGSRSPNCAINSSPLEHEGEPERFALVPVMGPSVCSITAQATREFGQRNATRPVLPVTFSGKRFDASTTSVIAPGQNFSASFRKVGGRWRASVFGLLQRIHQNRQRAVLGAALHAIDLLDGRKIEWIGRQTVKRVGGNPYDLSLVNEFGGVANRDRVRRIPGNFQLLCPQSGLASRPRRLPWSLPRAPSKRRPE
jgi:hypothetical protein